MNRPTRTGTFGTRDWGAFQVDSLAEAATDLLMADKHAISTSDTPGAWLGRMRCAASITTTRIPNRLNTSLSSSPIEPPPSTIGDAPQLARVHDDVLSSAPSSTIPGVRGIAGRVPVVMPIVRGRTSRSPTRARVA